MPRVLIVEDDPLNQKVLVDFLETVGFQDFECANNADEASAHLCAQSKTFDLVISDLHMPEGDGIEFLNAMQSTGCKAQIVIISGADPKTLNSASRLAHGFGLNLAGIFEKPIDPVKFESFLLKTMGQDSLTT